MIDLLEVIKVSLKDTVIGDGTTQTFDKVCLKLYAGIRHSEPYAAVYAKGKADGREQFKEELKELLGVQSCKCNEG
jgi:hypothetical protein